MKGQLEKHLAFCQQELEAEKKKSAQLQLLVDCFLQTFLSWAKKLHASMTSAHSVAVHNEVHASCVLADLVEWLATKSCADWSSESESFKRILASFDETFQTFLARPRRKDVEVDDLRSKLQHVTAQLKLKEQEMLQLQKFPSQYSDDRADPETQRVGATAPDLFSIDKHVQTDVVDVMDVNHPTNSVGKLSLEEVARVAGLAGAPNAPESITLTNPKPKRRSLHGRVLR